MRRVPLSLFLVAGLGCSEPPATSSPFSVVDSGGDAESETGPTCPEGFPCNDGDPCTENEVCVDGLCTWGKPKDCTLTIAVPCWKGECDPTDGKCVAVPADEGKPCPDEVCTTGSTCQGGSCVGVAVSCSELADACNAGICDPSTGTCKTTPAHDDGPCEDGNPCTLGERCYAGVCGALSPKGVLLQEEFSGDTSDWTLGPEWEIGPATSYPNAYFYGDPAYDHSPSSDNHVAGVKLGGSPEAKAHDWYWLESPPIDATAAPGALALTYWRWLNSDHPSYITHAVEAWDGAAWQVVWLQSGNAAHLEWEWSFHQHDLTALKNPALRVRFGFKVEETVGLGDKGSWNLDDVAIVAGTCTEAGCVSYYKKCSTVLPDIDAPCNAASCDLGTGDCLFTPANEGKLCSDNPCNPGLCEAGKCKVYPMPDGVFCLPNPLPAPCEAGVCAAGACVLTVAPDGYACTTDNPCAAGSCQAGTCVETPIADGNFCSTGAECTKEACEAGVCVVKESLVDGTPCGETHCTQGTCEGGVCTVTPKPDGTKCDPEVTAPPCTHVEGVCSGGSCEMVSVPGNEGGPCQLPFYLPCFGGVCQGGTCEAVEIDGLDCSLPFSSSCERGECAGGDCVAVPQPDGQYCWGPNQGNCHQYTCVQGACTESTSPDGAWCDDGNHCTDGDLCYGGSCVPGPECAMLDEPCKKGVCVNGSCEGETLPDGQSCPNLCDPNATCQSGVCKVTPSAGGTIYFEETFADNSQGWTLGPEWEIGSAQASPPPQYGNPDPGQDTTPTDDNGIAGVVLGGSGTLAVHPPFFLESPAIDLSGAADSVYLHYLRWLNSDGADWAPSTVWVFDGTSWVMIWQNAPSPENPTDSAWQLVTHDVTAYKNAAFRVRFGKEVKSDSAYPLTSWNLDDVLLGSLPCP